MEFFGIAVDADGLPTTKGDIMDAGATPDFFTQLLTRTFADLGATGPVVRIILLRDREYAGQRFLCGGFQAVALAGKNEIEFYNQAGELLKIARSEETEKKAAA